MESIAAFVDRCKESKIGGIEIVITDDKRESITALARKIPMTPNSQVMESMAIKEKSYRGY